jgi:hypothetical protein
MEVEVEFSFPQGVLLASKKFEENLKAYKPTCHGPVSLVQNYSHAIDYDFFFRIF